MKLRNNYYISDKGKYFVLTRKGKLECASWRNKTVGEPVDNDENIIVKWAVDLKFVTEVDIPGWTKNLIGYEVVYYHNDYRFPAGNSRVFPTLRAAKGYKKHYENYPWFDDELFIEEVLYDGVPLSESKIYNGKEIVDKEHYFGLVCYEVGDYFTREMVNKFMNMLPPACMRDDCMQIGEPESSRIDDKTGKERYTYDTFKRVTDDIYEYCGDCFRGENVMRGKELSYV